MTAEDFLKSDEAAPSQSAADFLKSEDFKVPSASRIGVNQPSQFSSGLPPSIAPSENPDYGFLKAVAEDKGRKLPEFLTGSVLLPISFAGKELARGAEDAAAVIAGNPEGFGNLKHDNPDEPTPFQKTVAETSKAHPSSTVAAKIAAGVTENAPMMVAGLPEGVAGRLISLGFTGQMIKQGGDAATALGAELGKNPEDRNHDAITSAISDLTQAGIFSGLAGKHALRKAVNATIQGPPAMGSMLKTPEGAQPPPPEQGPAHAEFITPPDLEAKAGNPAAPNLPIDPRLQAQLDAVDISPAPDIQKAILDKKIKSPKAFQRVFPNLNLTLEQAQEVLNGVWGKNDNVPEKYNQPTEGDNNATNPQPIEKGGQPEHQGTPSGQDVPTNQEQVREKESGKAGGGDSPVGTAEKPSVQPVQKITYGIDFNAIQKPHAVGVEAGLPLSESDVPELARQMEDAKNEGVKSGEAKDDKGFQSAMGKMTFLAGAIEGANKAGPNYDIYVKQKAANPKQATGGGSVDYDNGEIKPPAAEPVQPNSPTGIKNATVDAERAARGLPSAMQPARRSFGAVWDEAMAKLDKNPTASQDLVDSLRGNPRALTDAEDALLLHRQIELQNEYGKVSQDLAKAHDEGRTDDVPELRVRSAAISDALLDLYDIGKSSGTETGRGLNARKMMANEDYSLAQMEVSKRAANGGKPLDEKQSKEIKDLHDQIAKTQKAYDDYVANMQAKISAMESERAASEILRTAKPSVEPHIRVIADKIISALDRQAESALKRINVRRKEGRTMANLDPTDLVDHVIYGTSKLSKGAIEFGKWSAEMVSDLGEYVKPHLKQIWDAAHKSLDKTIEQSVSPTTREGVKRAVKSLNPSEQQDRIQTTIRNRVQSGKKNEITPQIQKLARIFVEQGIKTRDALIDAVHGFLRGIDPEMTRRDAMDAISGYGDFKPITKDQISVELRDLKGQMQQVAKLDDMQAGQPPLKTGMERRIPSKEESRLIKLVNDAKRKFQIPITDPNTQLRSSLDELKKRMQTRTDELEKKLADGDFATRTRPEPVKLDAEGLKLKAANERAKQAFNHGLQLDRLKNRTWLEKAQDTLVRWRRGFLLSSPATLAKLTAAAIQRMAITPLEEAVGAAYSKALPKIASRAPREGGLSSKAEAKSFVDAITKGMKDSWDVLRTGQSQLDVLFGQGREGYVSENFVLPSSVIDFFGHIHGALKSPVKRAEFSRSLEKRTEQAVRAGVDVSDPLVQTRLMVEAYKDANRSIFLQNNRVTSAYRAAVRTLEQKDKVTGRTPVGSKALATAAKVILPIVKVPTNIIAETFQYSLGTITGGTRLALALRRGVENLKPDEADLILRDLKKGSIGAAVLLLGYFNPDVIGGYYQQGQKRKDRDVKYGSLKIYGVNIPSVLLHNPLLETLQVGATVRRVQDSKLRKKDKNTQGLPSGIAAGALGLTEEVPFVNDTLQLSKMFNPQERNQFWGEYSKSLVVPQLVQFIANNSDSDRLGNPITRNPTNTIQHIETGIPGFRQDVPIKKK